MSTGNGVLVHVEGVEKTFRRGSEEIHVLAGLNLEVPTGEFLALMGPSGSGKTTLLNLIGGLDRATTRSRTLRRQAIHPICGRPPARQRAPHAGVRPQFYKPPSLRYARPHDR